jgi:hypothetical protein
MSLPRLAFSKSRNDKNKDLNIRILVVTVEVYKGMSVACYSDNKVFS